MAKWNRVLIRHANLARPNGQWTHWMPETAKASTFRPKELIARPVPDTPHLPTPPGERKNVHEPQEAHHVVLRLTQNEKAGRALVGGDPIRLVLQIAVRLKNQADRVSADDSPSGLLVLSQLKHYVMCF